MTDLVIEPDERTEALPALIDRASHALASAKSSGEVLEARDVARVAYDAAKSAGRMARAKKAHDDILSAVYRAQADALLIEARAKMRLADEYDAAQERGEVAGHGRSKVEPDNVTTAADLGLRRDEIHEARRLRDTEREHPGVIETTLNEMVERGEEPTKAALKNPFVVNNTGENEWYTPPEIIDAAREVLGGIGLDPASSAIANKTVQATIFFDKDDDGLSQSWQGHTIWMNPPYARELVGRFTDKLVETLEQFPSSAIVLVNNATETQWFQRMAKASAALCFPEKRVKFLDPAGNPGGPLQGQAIVYLGHEPQKFAERFAQFGFVVRP